MRALWKFAAVLVALSGCGEARLSFDASIPLDGRTALSVENVHGDVMYLGGHSEDAVALAGEIVAGGGMPAAVQARAHDAAWAIVDAPADTLAFTGKVPDRGTRIDVVLEGPVELGLQIATGGVLAAQDALGSHQLKAVRVEGVRLRGEVGVISGAGGMDVELWPFEDALVEFDTRGPSVLRLPADAGYDIEVFSDPYLPIGAEDLGFDTFVLEPGYLRAVRQPASIVVRGTVTGGTFDLLESK